MLSDLYNYIENNVNIFYHFYNISEYILSNFNNGSVEDELKIKIEQSVFYIAEKIHNNKTEWINSHYTIISQDYNYLVKRINQTNNILLKALYSEILYYSNNSIYKSYIKQAIDNYYELLKLYYTKLSINSDKELVHSIVIIIEKLLTFAILSKTNKLSDIKKLILKILMIKSNIELYHYLVISIISYMLQFDKIFKKDDFKSIDDIFWNLVNIKYKEGEYHYLITIISKYADKIDKKLCKLSYPWDDMLGKCYEQSMENANSAMVARIWCVDAIKHYTKANKYTNKIKKLEQKYITFKDKIELTVHNYQIDLTPFIDEAKKILEKSPIDIFKILSYSNTLYPPLEILKQEYGTVKNLFPIAYLDHNMNTSKISSLSTEQDLYLNNYKTYWNLYDRTIQYILIEGAKNNKINLENLIDYLMQYSCFFDFKTKTLSNKKKIKYNWSSSIISIFETYFNEINKWFLNPKINYPYLETATESFVLKFEPWIRHYLNCYKQSTISSVPQEKDIIREKDLNYLLYDSFITKNFDFNDLLYFRFLFIAKEGYNLRNEIAHGMLIPGQYTIELFNWVFFAFLRLSKYNFPTIKQNKFKKSKLVYTHNL